MIPILPCHWSCQVLYTVDVEARLRNITFWAIVVIYILYTMLLFSCAVPRNKKRTTNVVSTLKSNKKVSSLVDKVYYLLFGTCLNKKLFHLGHLLCKSED